MITKFQFAAYLLAITSVASCGGGGGGGGVSGVSASTISTFAGSGSVAGFSGDGGPAASALLHTPSGIAFDSNGNLFIADIDNSRIRKVAVDGTISTFAGTGVSGFSGDGGPASSAQISNARNVAVDTAGNVYISSVDSRVRVVNSSGVISTFAGTGVNSSTGDGGAATSATLKTPGAIVCDQSGNVYIRDYTACVVRKVSPAGVISTVAGNGTCGSTGEGIVATSAQIDNGEAMAIDGSGNLYITMQGLSTVRKISTQGIISTITNSLVSETPDGIAVDSSANIYVSYFNNANRIRKFTSSGAVSVVAGAVNAGLSGDGGNPASATFSNPGPLAIDRSGSLFVSDIANNRIRKITW